MYQGKVYMLSSPNYPKVYVGSTIQNLSRRMSRHRGKQNTCRSRELFEACGDSVKVEVLEEVAVNDRRELERIEIRYLKKYQDMLVNRNMPHRDRKERYRENIDKMRAYHRERYADHTLKAGGDGNYRQLQYYNDRKADILRRSALLNAWKKDRLPLKSTMIKHNLTEEEVKQFIADMNAAA